MKKFILVITIFFAIILSGCARGCEEFNRNIQMTERNYSVEVYSGGKLVRTYQFKGIINNQENSDGYYFSIGDSLHEVSGDIIIKSW